MHDIDRVYMELESDANEFTGGFGEEEVFSEEEIQDLASELLTVSSEEELEHFLGGLLKKAAGAVGRFARSSVGKQIGGMLKGLAKKALPVLGGALGNFVAPGIGGAIGSKLASAAGSAFGLELEGMSDEDQQFEIAKQFVRLAADAAQRAAQAPATANPAIVAKTAFAQAARRFAPGLASAAGAHGSASGRWVRRGNRIVLFGV